MSFDPADDGVGIVEVLVGLAVASMALMALGAVLSFVATAQARSAKSEALLGVLLDAQTLAAELGNYGTTITASSVGSVTLSVRDQAGLSVEMVLAKDGVLTAQANRQPVGLLDFSTFDGAALEYFSRAGDAFSWKALSEEAADQALLIRVVLIEGRRLWSIVLWGRSGLVQSLAFDEIQIDRRG